MFINSGKVGEWTYTMYGEVDEDVVLELYSQVGTLVYCYENITKSQGYDLIDTFKDIKNNEEEE